LGFKEKFDSFLQTIWKIVLWAFMAVTTYFYEEKHIFHALAFIIVVDAILGILVSLKKGGFILSYLGRETCWKAFFYVSIFTVVSVIEHTLGSQEPFSLYLFFALAGLFELISIVANSLILKPDFLLSKFLIKPLKGEIAKKLGISVECVEDILSSNERFKDFIKKDKDEKGCSDN
jgi:hypothetical protein